MNRATHLKSSHAESTSTIHFESGPTTPPPFKTKTGQFVFVLTRNHAETIFSVECLDLIEETPLSVTARQLLPAAAMHLRDLVDPELPEKPEASVHREFCYESLARAYLPDPCVPLTTKPFTPPSVRTWILFGVIVTTIVVQAAVSVILIALHIFIIGAFA